MDSEQAEGYPEPSRQDLDRGFVAVLLPEIVISRPSTENESDDLEELGRLLFYRISLDEMKNTDDANSDVQTSSELA